MDHRSGSIYRTFSDSRLCGGRHSGQRGRELPDRLTPLSVWLSAFLTARYCAVYRKNMPGIFKVRANRGVSAQDKAASMRTANISKGGACLGQSAKRYKSRFPIVYQRFRCHGQVQRGRIGGCEVQGQGYPHRGLWGTPPEDAAVVRG